MLRELWESLTAAAAAEAGFFGHRAEMAALAARHRRQRGAWAPHLEACRRFILDAAARAPAGTPALVAGSGLLLEVPVEELAQRFSHVVLADLVHARSVRRRVARWANVTLVTLDLTGALGPLALALRGRAAPPSAAPPPQPASAFLDGGFGFAASCNLMSQLPLLPLVAMERRGLGEEARIAFAQALLVQHLEWLRRVAPVAALYTDIGNGWGRRGKIEVLEDSLWGLTLAPPDRGWDWAIAPAPEEDRRLDRVDRVAAWFQAPAYTGPAT